MRHQILKAVYIDDLIDMIDEKIIKIDGQQLNYFLVANDFDLPLMPMNFR